MEIKDLALLLSIPVILVTIFIYFDNASITGAAISQENQNKIIGTYSINPSFRASFKYDLQDYEKIKQSMDNIIKCAEQGEEIQACVDSENNNDFEWSLGCDTGPEKVLYDLAEFVEDCFASDDKDCICKKSMDIGKEEITKYGLSKKEFRLETSQDMSSRKLNIKVAEPKIDLNYDVKLNSYSIWSPSLYIISYAEDKLIGINMFFTDELSGDRKSPGPLKELVLYKTEANNLKIVDFVKQEGNNLIYPNNDVKKLGNARPCNLKPKNIQRFCVTKKNFRIMVYDTIDSQVKERPLVIKFASYIPDAIPEPLKGTEVYDTPKSEKQVLVRWEKSSAKDIAKYKIYYADSQLDIFNRPTEELRKNPDVFVHEIDAVTAQTVELEDSIIPAECDFDFQSKKCVYNTVGGGKTFIEKDKIYYTKPSNSYTYLLPVKEDKAYDFSVTAVDKANNEINNIDLRQKLLVVKNVKSVDDLPPDSSFQSPSPVYDEQNKQITFNLMNDNLKNIDGSKLEEKDLAGYKIYYKKYDKMVTDEEQVIARSSLRDLKLNELKQAQVIESSQNKMEVDISAENSQSGNVFLFVIIAADISGNPKEDQFKARELGAVPIKITIP